MLNGQDPLYEDGSDSGVFVEMGDKHRRSSLVCARRLRCGGRPHGHAMELRPIARAVSVLILVWGDPANYGFGSRVLCRRSTRSEWLISCSNGCFGDQVLRPEGRVHLGIPWDAVAVLGKRGFQPPRLRHTGWAGFAG